MTSVRAPQRPGDGRVAATWVSLYLVVALAPLALSLAQLDPGRGFWVNLSVSFGFVGLAILGLQFALAARSTRVAGPTGVLPLLQYHREVTYLAVVLVVAHPLVLVLWDSRFLALLDVVHAPVRAKLAVLSVLALLTLVATSVWRRKLRLGYRAWQLLHAVLAIVVVSTALAHVLLIGYYVDQPWERALWIVYTLAFVWLSIWVRVVKPLQRWRRRWRVVEVREQPGRSHTVVLELVDPRSYGPRGFRFHAGQFAWVMVGRSPFALSYHPFSFSSSAERPSRVELTIRELGEFTASIGQLRSGESVYLDGPWGRFRLDPDPTRPVVMIAAGIGVTPMLSLLSTIADRRDPRRCVLVLGNRDQDSIPCLGELTDLETRLDLEVVHVLSAPSAGWSGRHGHVDPDVLAAVLAADLPAAQVFLCGPPAMMDTAEAWCAEQGVAEHSVHSERFVMV